MFARWAKIFAAALVTGALLFSPAYAQKKKNQQIQEEADSGPKPVVQYILVVVMLAIPIALICRSSRRATYG